MGTDDWESVMAREIRWARSGGYEVSSKGDARFSAFRAILPDGRTIEEHYQCDVKGYDIGGRNWRLGKGKPPLDRSQDMYACYLALWAVWARAHPNLLDQLSAAVCEHGRIISDRFATTPVNQAHALADILNAMYPNA